MSVVGLDHMAATELAGKFLIGMGLVDESGETVVGIPATFPSVDELSQQQSFLAYGYQAEDDPDDDDDEEEDDEDEDWEDDEEEDEDE